MIIEITFRLAMYSILLTGLLSAVPGRGPADSLGGPGGLDPNSNASYQLQGQVVKAYYDTVRQHFDRNRLRQAKEYLKKCATENQRAAGVSIDYDGEGAGVGSANRDLDFSNGWVAPASTVLDAPVADGEVLLGPSSLSLSTSSECSRLASSLRLRASLLTSSGIRFVDRGGRLVMDMNGTGWYMSAEMRCSSGDCGAQDRVFVVVWGFPTNPFISSAMDADRLTGFFTGVDWIPGGYVVLKSRGPSPIPNSCGGGFPDPASSCPNRDSYRSSMEVAVWVQAPFFADPFRHGPKQSIEVGDSSVLVSRGHRDVDSPPMIVNSFLGLANSRISAAAPSRAAGHSYASADFFQVVGPAGGHPSIDGRPFSSPILFEDPRNFFSFCSFVPLSSSGIEVFQDSIFWLDSPRTAQRTPYPGSLCSLAFLDDGQILAIGESRFQSLYWRSSRILEVNRVGHGCVSDSESSGGRWSFCSAAEYFVPRGDQVVRLSDITRSGNAGLFASGPLIAAIIDEPMALRQEVFGL